MKKQLIITFSIIGVIFIIFFSSWKEVNFTKIEIEEKSKTEYSQDTLTLSKKSPSKLQKDKNDDEFYGIPVDSLKIIEGKIKRNERVGDILSKYGIKYSELYNLVNQSQNKFNFRKIKSGNNYKVLCKKDSTNKARCFVYEASPKTSYIFDFGKEPGIRKEIKNVDTTNKIARGIIRKSLYMSMKSNGHSPVIVNKLSDIFAWQIDFFRIQKGDRYKVIYEQLEIEGEPFATGKIKAAFFKHSDDSYYAFHFPKNNSYYDDKGNSIQKLLLKAPLNFSRISSGFSHSRYHPVLHIYRPHHGIDYAAPRGTPVVSVGDGKIVAASYSRGAGNYLKIRHSNGYLTKYLHLSGFASGIYRGKRVKQGQVIAYVGSTGLSTGPHLDYRVVKNGRYVNPLHLDLPSAESLPKKYKDEFEKYSNKMKQNLDKILYDYQMEAKLHPKQFWCDR